MEEKHFAGTVTRMRNGSISGEERGIVEVSLGKSFTAGLSEGWLASFLEADYSSSCAPQARGEERKAHFFRSCSRRKRPALAGNPKPSHHVGTELLIA